MVKKPRSQGCRTCVERRIKCDQTRPFCKRCVKAKRQCPGFTGIQFVDEGPALRESYEDLTEKKPDAKVSASPSPSSRSSESNRPQLALGGSTGSQSDGWQHSAFERMALVSLFAPTVYQDQLFASFLTSIRQPVLSASLPSHSVWLAEVAGKSTLSNALTWAIRALSVSQIGRRARDDALIETSRFLYGKALLKLNTAIRDADEGLSSDTLSATLLLSFYEIFNCTSAYSWVRHAGGAGKLIRIRGPARHRSGFDRLVFLACRYSIIMEAFQQNTACFLDDSLWRPLFRGGVADERGPDGSVAALNNTVAEFFHEIVTYPEYMNDVNKTVGDPDVTLEDLRNMHAKGISNRTSLLEIYDRVCQAMSGAGNEVIETASPTNDQTFPLVNEFPNILVASLYCGYRTIMSVTNISIMGLEAKMARLYDSNSPSKGKGLASVSPIPRDDDNSVFDFTKTPIWEAARNGNVEHVYIAENAEYARDVCKSAEYMARAPFLGPFFLIVSIRHAMRMSITKEEKIWIVKMLRDIGMGMGLAAIEIERYKGTKQGRFVAEREAGEAS